MAISEVTGDMKKRSSADEEEPTEVREGPTEEEEEEKGLLEYENSINCSEVPISGKEAPITLSILNVSDAGKEKEFQNEENQDEKKGVLQPKVQSSASASIIAVLAQLSAELCLLLKSSLQGEDMSMGPRLDQCLQLLQQIKSPDEPTMESRSPSFGKKRKGSVKKKKSKREGLKMIPKFNGREKIQKSTSSTETAPSSISSEKSVERSICHSTKSKLHTVQGRSARKSFKPCHSCGELHHRENCLFRNAWCSSCNRMGHLSKVCRSKYRPAQMNGKGEERKFTCSSISSMASTAQPWNKRSKFNYRSNYVQWPPIQSQKSPTSSSRSTSPDVDAMASQVQLRCERWTSDSQRGR
jgi:hypothetical protein